jgi:hypothetical protein
MIALLCFVIAISAMPFKSEHRILCLKPNLRLEWRGQNDQNEAEQSEHGPQTLGDSFG